MDRDDLPESDLRKRAAWLLAMLAVVAGLFVVLSLTLFNGSGGGGGDSNQGQIADPPTDISTPASGSAPQSSRAPSTTRTSTAPSGNGSASSSTSGTVPKPTCPGDSKCSVTGDVTGAMSAINAYRTQHGKKAVPTTASPKAAKCALSSGNDCPDSFVWVRVTDLSGSGVVKGVNGFNSNDDLLTNSTTSFEVGWAYDPGSKSLSCAVIRND